METNCLVRAWKLSDAEELAKLLNNRKILNNLRDGLPFPYTIADARDYICAMLAADKDTVFAFAIEFNGKVAGSISVFRKENIHYKTAELGYYVGESFWNMGIATSAVKQACAYIFDNTDIIRIFAEPFARNGASCRVLEKAGFQCEGALRANAVKCGVVEDMKIYARIKQVV